MDGEVPGCVCYSVVHGSAEGADALTYADEPVAGAPGVFFGVAGGSGVGGCDGDAGEVGFGGDGDGAPWLGVFFGVVADFLDEFVEGGAYSVG